MRPVVAEDAAGPPAVAAAAAVAAAVAAAPAAAIVVVVVDAAAVAAMPKRSTERPTRGPRAESIGDAEVDCCHGLHLSWHLDGCCCHRLGHGRHKCWVVSI